MNEAIMAILVASTAFSGLTGVIVGQVIKEKLQLQWMGIRNLLILSGGLGVLVAALSVIWLAVSGRNEYLAWALIGIFIFQLLLFWIAASSYWYRAK